MDKKFIRSLIISALIVFTISALIVGIVVGFNRYAASEMLREGTACVESGGQYVCSRYSCVCLSAKKK